MNKRLRTGIFFAVIAVWLAWLNWYPGFRDSDGFYHAKIVEIMRDSGLVRDFHWLPLTVLADHFADHHMLYHALAVPLASIISALTAVKVISVVLGFLVLVLLYTILKYLKAPYPHLLITLLAINPYFIMRATMTKASGAAMLVQFAVLACVLKGERLGLFLLSIIYVWMHAGFPFAFVIVAAYATSKIFVRSAEGKKISVLVREVWVEDRWNFAAVLAGIFIGLVVNPYFPENLYFYWHQIVQVAVRGTPRELTVGAEWYGVPPIELFSVCMPLLITLAVPLVAIALTKRLPSWNRATFERFSFLFFLAAGTFVLTLRSNRHSEYLIPYLALLIGEVHRILLPLIDWREAWAKFKKLFANTWMRRAAIFAAAILVLVPLTQISFTVRLLRGEFLPWYAAKPVAEFARSVAEPNEIIFDGNWDFFPLLWYWNSDNRYISGLDARFFSAKDPELALAYQKLGIEKEGAEKVFSRFPVRFIIMPKDKIRGKVVDQLKADPTHFIKLFEDDTAVLFEKKLK